MPTTTTTLFPPPTRSNAVDNKGFLAIPLRQWLFTLQNLLQLNLVDTSTGDYTESLPPAGLNSNTGQSNQNSELIYIKSSADAHTYTLTGGVDGPVQLSQQFAFVRFKSDGTNWWPVAGIGGGGVTSDVNIKEFGGALVALGQAMMAGSIPVTIASDQSAIPVSADALPLPAGASTAAKQDTGNMALAAIESALANPLPLPTNAAQETGGNLAAAKTDLDSILANQTNGTQLVKVSNPRGVFKSSVVSATGAQVSITVPANKKWVLYSALATLNCDSNVANRNMELVLTDSSSNDFSIKTISLNQTASTFNGYIFGPGLTDATSLSNEFPTFGIPQSVLGPSFKVSTSIGGLQTGDAVSLTLNIEEFDA